MFPLIFATSRCWWYAINATARHQRSLERASRPQSTASLNLMQSMSRCPHRVFSRTEKELVALRVHASRENCKEFILTTRKVAPPPNLHRFSLVLKTCASSMWGEQCSCYSLPPMRHKASAECCQYCCCMFLSSNYEVLANRCPSFQSQQNSTCSASCFVLLPPALRH